MNIKAVLFDLDGTLLPMDQEVFVKTYFGGLARKLAPKGYEPEKLIQGIWGGVKAMVMNNGDRTNERVFWDFFCDKFGQEARKDLPCFEEFYRVEFQKVQEVCGYEPKAGEIVRKLKEAGVRIVLATNPIFPAIATESRMRWAGLKPEDFEFYTTYENINYSKPNLKYYREILKRLNLQPEECLMVGNDVGEDMIVTRMGMEGFLLTNCLINKDDMDICLFPHGGFRELEVFLEKKIAE